MPKIELKKKNLKKNTKYSGTRLADRNNRDALRIHRHVVIDGNLPPLTLVEKLHNVLPFIVELWCI